MENSVNRVVEFPGAGMGRLITINSELNGATGTPPLTRFFGPVENRVKGKPRYMRSILVLKPKNGEYVSPKSTF